MDNKKEPAMTAIRSEKNRGGEDLYIRPAVLSDARQLAAFGKKTFQDAFARLHNKEDFDQYVSEAFSEDRIRSELNESTSFFFIAELSRQWVGYVKLAHTRPPDCVTKLPAIELARLYAAQEYWGCGIGPALIKACTDFARNHACRSIWLGSWKENLRGNRFYQKMGFEITGTKTFVLGSDIQEDHVFIKVL